MYQNSNINYPICLQAMSDDNSSNQASSKEVTFTIKLDPMKDPVTGNNNFLLYRKHVTEKLASRYPLLSDIFEDNVPYELANPSWHRTRRGRPRVYRRAAPRVLSDSHGSPYGQARTSTLTKRPCTSTCGTLCPPTR